MKIMPSMNETAAQIVITDVYVQNKIVNKQPINSVRVHAVITLIPSKIPNLVNLLQIKDKHQLAQLALNVYLVQLHLVTPEDIQTVINSINKTINVPISFYMGAFAMNKFLNSHGKPIKGII